MLFNFTGKKLQLVDPATGEVKTVEVFVSILGCSQLTFVMAVASQRKEDFIYACKRVLCFHGGIPQVQNCHRAPVAVIDCLYLYLVF